MNDLMDLNKLNELDEDREVLGHEEIDSILKGDDVQFSRKQKQFLTDLLTPRCCHTTGLHDPQHFVEGKYVCNDQKARAFDRARKYLGLPEVTPADAVSEDGCERCKNAKAKGDLK